MKTLILLLFLSLFVFSCSNQETDELQQEYEKINAKNASKEQQDSAQKKPKGPKYVEGKDYTRIEPAYATEVSNKVVVYEFFGYSCPHCFYFEPFIDKWLNTKPYYVQFKRVPLNFQAGWDVLQQGYLTAESMGITHNTHKKLFEAIHNDHKKFKSIDEMAEWYADVGKVSKEIFLSTADSFILDSKQREADKLGFVMQVRGTPTIVVNGKYRPAKTVRDRDEIMKIVSFLIKKEAKEMGLEKNK